MSEIEPAETPRCPECGYTEWDKVINCDHNLCGRHNLDADTLALLRECVNAFAIMCNKGGKRGALAYRMGDKCHAMIERLEKS